MATFIAVDVETANSDPSSICQIGIAIYQAGKLAKSYSILVNPKRRFATKNISIHGITSKDVSKSLVFKDAFPPIGELLSGYTVVSHTMFDRNAFQKACETYNLDFPDCEWVDSSMIARRAWSEVSQRGYGLQNLCDRIGFEYDAHDAEQDAIACGQVVMAALADTGWTFSQAIKESKTKSNKWAGKNVTRQGNESGEHYGKTICFTGDLPISRTAAAKLAAKKGYEVKNNVSKKVDHLIVGINGDNTTKHKRAVELQSQGHPITIGLASDIFTIDEMADLEDDADSIGEDIDEFEYNDENDETEASNVFGCIVGVIAILFLIIFILF